MSPGDFTASLLRASANGFAGLTASRTAERSGESGDLEGGFEAWQAHFRTLVQELAAASEDGGVEAFASKVGWTREAFAARGLSTEILAVGLDELEGVLQESLPPSAWTPLPSFFEAARSELASDEMPAARDVAGVAGTVVEGYLARLEKGDAAGAIATVTKTVEDGTVTIPEALEVVLTSALHEIGRRWHTDAINIAQEHFATQVTGRLLERLLLMAPVAEENGRAVLLTMIEGDAHDLGLRVVAALFELDGWRTVCLGANMPAADLPAAVEDFGVDLVLLGATLNPQRDAVARAIGLLREANPELKILVGGPAFAAKAERVTQIGADGCALSPSSAVALGRELVGA
jgi:methanogenic corrinoid protein MtbC1